MKRYSFAVLTTVCHAGINATHLPLILKENEGEKGTLYGHIAHTNPQVKHLNGDTQGLAVFSGPHAYISAAWYDNPDARVPTWNYISVQARGCLQVLPKSDWLGELEHLTETFEPDGAWTVSRAEDYVKRLMGGIVFFKMGITDLRGIEKMSQNKGHAENQTVMSELKKRNEFGTAEAMEHALHKAKQKDIS